MRLIDANDVVQDILYERDKINRALPPQSRFGDALRGGIRKALRCVEEAPTIDAVPVVRCKDCVYSRERNSYEKEYLVEGVVICTNDDVHDDAWGAMYEDDFCSYGERKDGDEND